MCDKLDKDVKEFLVGIENTTGEPIKKEICDLLEKFNIKYAGVKLKEGISCLMEKFEADSSKEEVIDTTGEKFKDEISDLLKKFEADSKIEEAIETAGEKFEEGISDLLKKFEADSKNEETIKDAGGKLKEGISDLLKKFKADSKDEETIKDAGEELREQLVKLAKLYKSHNDPLKKIEKEQEEKEEKEEKQKKETTKYLNDIKEIKKAIKDILKSEKELSEDKKEYYDSLMDDIQYLIIYKLCFLVVIREQEVDWILKRREITDDKKENTHERTRHDPFNDAMGLAFSGGGIRSSTFNLGLLQALERYNILKSVDYLSTVSGGGYIGSSLTWFMSKDESIFPFGTSRKDHGGKSGKILSWLRDHGNYMAPGNGLGLPALIVAVLTSVLINILIMVPLLLLLIWGIKELDSFKWLQYVGLGVLILTFLLSIFVYVCSGLKKCCGIQKRCRTFREKKLHRVAGTVLIVGLLVLAFGMIPVVYDFLIESPFIKKWININTAMSSISFSGIVAFLAAFKGLTGTNETKGFRSALLTIGLSLMIFGIFLWFYHIVKPNGFQYSYLLGFVVLALVLAGLVNINHISIHRYYRNRLMEAFMPWAIIGEDRSESDEFPLTKTPKTRAPYHIINTTVNMVDSGKTKQRERGGDNFILSPLFCGSEATGYAATSEYIEGEVNLATALAISGAAVNPNMYVTRSKPITFLMALFNVRLGYWIKNPIYSSSSKKNILELSYLDYILSEMTSKGLNETNKYIHLSDGGHFENLGLYELVRRRCRYIIVSDASSDPNWSFGDLARAIEMVRIDFGAEVNLDTRPLQQKGPTRIADQGFIRGTITYKDGKIADLIYVNTVIIDGLSEDIYSYRRTNPKFPEQTTADQFFDEKQFEAYRELGFELGAHLCGKTFHEDFTAIFKNESKGTSPKSGEASFR